MRACEPGRCAVRSADRARSADLEPVLADSSAAIKAFRLRKEDGNVYDVALTTHGLQCDCPDFLFHRDGLDAAGCKQIKSLVACGLLDREGDAQ
jgi:hypothetical protein